VKLKIFVVALCLSTTQLRTDFHMYFNSGNECYKTQNFAAAIKFYEQAIAANPAPAQLYFNLGLAHAKLNAHDNAVIHFKKAIERNPNYGKAYAHLADSLYKLNKLDIAIENYEKALLLEPNNIETHLGIARVLVDQRKFTQAGQHFNFVIQREPNNINALFDLANTLNMENKTEQALERYFKLLPLTGESPSMLYNIAYTLKKLGRIPEAIDYYQKTLIKDPTNAEAHFSLGLAYLISGNFTRGWPEYEWRFKRNENSKRSFSRPLWDGSDLQGKIIAIYAEQGLGDTFEFIRYAQVLKEQGATVIVAVQSPLVKILGLCPFIDKVFPLGTQLPDHDFAISLMSLPHILKTTVDTVPNKLPYLYADLKLTEQWYRALSHDKNFKIGLCWQGNPNYTTPFLRHTVAAKSVTASTFAPLADCAGVSFYSLQKISGTDQLKDLPAHFVVNDFGQRLDEEHGRFMDTAAIIQNLNLVLTVDTSIAHLAGGLGVPVWLLLPNPPDWRWMLDRTDTPWYPNMRLFRQPTPGDWDSVIKEVGAELTKLIHQEHATEDLMLADRTMHEIIEKIGTLQTMLKKIQHPQQLNTLRAEFEAMQLKIRKCL